MLLLLLQLVAKETSSVKRAKLHIFDLVLDVSLYRDFISIELPFLSCLELLIRFDCIRTST